MKHIRGFRSKSLMVNLSKGRRGVFVRLLSSKLLQGKVNREKTLNSYLQKVHLLKVCICLYLDCHFCVVCYFKSCKSVITTNPWNEWRRTLTPILCSISLSDCPSRQNQINENDIIALHHYQCCLKIIIMDFHGT